MTATVAGIHLGLDTHANRPAANTVPDGSIYSCSTHTLVYKSNLAGNSWATWANLGGTAQPPGYEFDYVAKTTQTSVTGTTEAGATTIVTGNGVAYDGSTVIIIEFFCDYFQQAGSDQNSMFWLYDGSSSIGRIALITGPGATGYTGNLRVPILARVRITPSAATKTYSIRGSVGSGTGTVDAGAGGNGVAYPCYIRQTKV